MAEKRDKILQRLLVIIANDYAGMPEKSTLNQAKQWLAAFAKAWHDNQLDDRQFTLYVQHYLKTLLDPNLELLVSPACPYQPEQCGFSVRRFDDELYVTEVREDTRFVAGDALVALNQNPPLEHLRYAIGNPVNGDDPDRQLWDDLVMRCSHVQVRHKNGHVEDIPIKRFSNPSKNPFELQALDVSGFVLQSSDRIIIDLRTIGFALHESTYKELLGAMFSERINIGDIMGQEVIYTNYTQRNCALRRAQLEALQAQYSSQEASWIDEELDKLSSLEGKGFIQEQEQENCLAEGQNPGLPLTLLTDVTTGAAGERLVRIAQEAQSKGLLSVQTVGRATSGASDYTNPLSISFDEFYTLLYPMSKTEDAYEGRGLSGKGIPPDVYLPFTPEECTHDSILEYAKA